MHLQTAQLRYMQELEGMVVALESRQGKRHQKEEPAQDWKQLGLGL